MPWTHRLGPFYWPFPLLGTLVLQIMTWLTPACYILMRSPLVILFEIAVLIFLFTVITLCIFFFLFYWIGNSSALCGVGWGTRIAWRSKRLQTYGGKLYLASRWEFSWSYWQGALVFLHVAFLYSCLGFLTVQWLSSKEEHSQRKEVEVVSLLKVWAQKQF